MKDELSRAILAPTTGCEGRVYYNDFDPQACDYLENLIAEGLIPAGTVDRRSITEVQPGDLDGFNHVHFFAGVGGWAKAALLARWPPERPLWTGSCPCQPFSLAGEKLGTDDERHLWPDFFRLIDARRPPVVVGEQVAGALGYGWFDGVASDLGSADYASRTVDIPAAAVDSPQIRQRLYWAALLQRASHDVASADSGGLRQVGRDDSEGAGHPAGAGGADHDAAVPGGRDAPGAGGGEALASSDGWRGAQPDLGPQGGVAAPLGPHDIRGVGAERGRGPVARSPGQRRWQQQPERGPEGRTPPPGDDAGERRGDVGSAEGVRLQSGDAGAVGGPGAAQPQRSDDGGGSLDVARAERGGCQGGDAAHGGGGEHGATLPPDGGYRRNGSWWADHRWIICHDGKGRRIPDPGIPLLVTGVRGRVAVVRSGRIITPEEAAITQEEVRWVSRVAAWKGFGNAINPVLAAQVLAALLDG